MPPITSDLWKERLRAPRLLWTQIAAQAPDRGIATSTQSGVSQIYAWDVPIGDLRPLTEKPGGVTFGLLSPDGCFLYFMDDAKGNETGHYVRVPYEGGPTEDLTPNLPAYGASTTPFPQPAVAFSPSGNALTFRTNDADGFHLCRVGIAPDGALSPPQFLYSTKSLIRTPLLTEDGSLVVVAASERTGKQQYALLALDVVGARVGELYDGPDSSIEPIAFSPAPGDTRLLASSDRTGDKRPLLWDARTGERRDLLLPDVAGEIVPLNWSPDGKRVLLCQFSSAVQRLYVYHLETDKATRMDHPDGAFTFFGSLGVSFSPDGREILAAWQNAQNKARLIALDAETGALTRTVLSAGDAPPGRSVRSVTFPSSDGQTVQAWLCVPEGAGPFPTVLEVHGGPHGVVTETFGMGSLWAENGFAWLSVNFRGSTTFGRDFMGKIWGDAGHWELEDMVAARDFLVGQGIAQPDKVLVTGGSYGGYLTLLALGKRPDLWAGGLALIAIADQTLTWEDSSGFLQGVTTASFGGTPAEKPELYRLASPITYAEDVRAPLLVIQGRHDTRCPPRQMEVYEAKMKGLGKNIEVVWFDSGHGTGATEELITWYDRMLRFARRVTGPTN